MAHAPRGPPAPPPPHPRMCAPLYIPSLLVRLVLVECSLAEPADTGLDAAGGVSSIQVPRHRAVGQHLSPAQPLCVPQAWGDTGHGWDPHTLPSTGTPVGIQYGDWLGSSTAPPHGEGGSWHGRTAPWIMASVSRKAGASGTGLPSSSVLGGTSFSSPRPRQDRHLTEPSGALVGSGPLSLSPCLTWAAAALQPRPRQL